ncbi:MAG: hypothetical protein WCX81_03630 [Monoglobales bacterium]
MGKQIFILNSDNGNAGIAKIMSNGKRSVLSIQLDEKTTGRKKCNILSNDKIVEVGTLSRDKTSFELDSSIPVQSVIIGEPDDAIVWSGERPLPAAQKDAPEDVAPPQPDYFTFENFFGGGFDWQRIRGNFVMYDYSIVHHILSGKNIYPAINRAGYYVTGMKKDGDATFIAIAIPLIKGIENPFEGLSVDTYEIKSPKMTFSAVCAGIDKTGEFFCSL